MNLAERLRERGHEIKFKLAERSLPYDEWYPSLIYMGRCFGAADKREARRIAAGDPAYIKDVEQALIDNAERFLDEMSGE